MNNSHVQDYYLNKLRMSLRASIKRNAMYLIAKDGEILPKPTELEYMNRLFRIKQP